MKQFTFLFLFTLLGAIVGNLFAQVPELINYQAVARNTSGQVLVNQAVLVRLSVRQSTAGGNIQYQETHNLTSNAQGLINLQIGGGTPNSGTFTDITWADGQPKFLQIELDPDGAGVQPFVNMGSQQLVSVPYALYTAQAAIVPTDNDTSPTNELQTLDLNGSILTLSNGGGSVNLPGASDSWLLTGNQGTNPENNFIGTTDFNPLVFKMNSQQIGKVDYNNVFWGKDAGINNVNSLNVGIGASSLKLNTNGSSNVAFGCYSMENNTSGSQNVAVGINTIKNNSLSTANTAIGAYALGQSIGNENVAIGSFALFSNNGNHNVAIGNGAGDENSGNTNYCTFVGDDAFFYPGVGTNNSSALGYISPINADNKVRLGNTAVTAVEGPVAYTASDGRFKQNISEEVHGLDFITKLRPVVYNYKAREHQQFLMSFMPDSLQRIKLANLDFTHAESIRQSGFIAQEVEVAANTVGYDFNGIHKPENETDYYTLSYQQFVVPLVKAVQEQQQMLETQNKKIDEQSKTIEQLQQKAVEIDALKSELQQIKSLLLQGNK